LDSLWTPDQLFAQHDPQVDRTAWMTPTQPLPSRWLDAATLLSA